jgi:hypothetical protein
VAAELSKRRRVILTGSGESFGSMMREWYVPCRFEQEFPYWAPDKIFRFCETPTLLQPANAGVENPNGIA